MRRGDLRAADKLMVELDELADGVKLQLVRVGGWGLKAFEREEERLERLSKELDLLGEARAKAIQELRGTLLSLLEEKGVVPLEEVPRASLMGRPVVGDEDVVSLFEGMVREGFRGVLDGRLLVNLDVVEGRVRDISRVYSRIRIEKVAEKVGISEKLVVDVLERMISSGVIQGRIDDAGKTVEFQGGQGGAEEVGKPQETLADSSWKQG